MAGKDRCDECAIEAVPARLLYRASPLGVRSGNQVGKLDAKLCSQRRCDERIARRSLQRSPCRIGLTEELCRLNPEVADGCKLGLRERSDVAPERFDIAVERTDVAPERLDIAIKGADRAV